MAIRRLSLYIPLQGIRKSGLSITLRVNKGRATVSTAHPKRDCLPTPLTTQDLVGSLCGLALAAKLAINSRVDHWAAGRLEAAGICGGVGNYLWPLWFVAFLGG